jgi:hypothetical protein
LSTDHRSRYRGKNLLYLLLALGIPILLLYCSLTATFIAGETPVGRQHSTLLAILSRGFATLFYFVQFLAVWYLKRTFFPAPSSKPIRALQFTGLLIGALLCSVCGAIACEAFGYDLFLRVMRRGM